MSVVVKGMRMPDHCWECWLMRNMICGASGELIPSSGKRKYCPLVALPEKHGRLIDADALAAESLMDGAYGYVDTKEIYDSPTIVEAEDGT